MTQEEKPKKNKHISYILRFCVAGAALYYVFHGEDLGELRKLLLSLNIWIFAVAISLFIITNIIIGLRWNILLRAQAIKIPWSAAVKLYFLGLFYNNFLPSSVGGDFVRAWYVTRHTDKRLEAALSVFIDRVIGLTCLLIMAILCYWFFPVPMENQQVNLEIDTNINVSKYLSEYQGVILGTLIAFIAIFLVLLSNSKSRSFLKKACLFVYAPGLKVVTTAFKAVRLYCTKPWVLILTMVLTVIAQSNFIIGLWLIGKGLGIEMEMKYYFVFFPISWVIGALPISIGGLGIVEGGLKTMFAWIGVSGGVVLALVLCHRMIVMVGSLPGMVIHMTGAHLPGGKISIDEEASIT